MILGLKINDRFKARKVQYFSNFQLSLGYDQFGSTFSLSFYFDPENPDHKELACVTHFHDCEVSYGDEILVTGFTLSQGFKFEPEKQLATISGYSKPGLFNDCNIPPNLYPLQSDGLSLLSIAKKLTRPWNEETKYGIGIKVDESVQDLVNKSLKTSTAGETDTIGGYLTQLAQQKKVIISHDEFGNLLFTQAKTKQKPILDLDFRNGMIPGTKLALQFDGQQVHSDIFIVRQASSDGGNAGQYHVKNPYCPVFYKPKVVTQSSGDDIDTKEVALRELASEWENLKVSIETDRWKIGDSIIKPNNLVSIYAPELYIYKKCNWFIRSIDYVGNEKETIATLNCVIPEVVNGEMARSIFEGINMHP